MIEPATDTAFSQENEKELPYTDKKNPSIKDIMEAMEKDGFVTPPSPSDFE